MSKQYEHVLQSSRVQPSHLPHPLPLRRHLVFELDNVSREDSLSDNGLMARGVVFNSSLLVDPMGVVCTGLGTVPIDNLLEDDVMGVACTGLGTVANDDLLEDDVMGVACTGLETVFIELLEDDMVGVVCTGLGTVPVDGLLEDDMTGVVRTGLGTVSVFNLLEDNMMGVVCTGLGTVSVFNLLEDDMMGVACTGSGTVTIDDLLEDDAINVACTGLGILIIVRGLVGVACTGLEIGGVMESGAVGVTCMSLGTVAIAELLQSKVMGVACTSLGIEKGEFSGALDAVNIGLKMSRVDATEGNISELSLKGSSTTLINLGGILRDGAFDIPSFNAAVFGRDGACMSGGIAAMSEEFPLYVVVVFLLLSWELFLLLHISAIVA